jgi:hypothetical protein
MSVAASRCGSLSVKVVLAFDVPGPLTDKAGLIVSPLNHTGLHLLVWSSPGPS